MRSNFEGVVCEGKKSEVFCFEVKKHEVFFLRYFFLRYFVLTLFKKNTINTTVKTRKI